MLDRIDMIEIILIISNTCSSFAKLIGAIKRLLIASRSLLHVMKKTSNGELPSACEINT